MSLKLIITSMLALLPLSACGTGGKTAKPLDRQGASKTQVDVIGNVIHVCDVDQDRAYFDIDSTALDAREHAMLREVAACMKTGALRGHTLMVSGYADESGPRAYNEDLALARARTVAFELRNLGVPGNRIYVRALGERNVVFKARPHKDYDRRVELSIVERDI